MTTNQLHDLLDDIAAQEIPDTMNLLPQIQAQLAAKPTVRARPLLHLSRVAAVFIALMVATVAYAVYQTQFFSGDTGISTVGALELITPLDLIQTHPNADVNVILHWGYADGNRIAVSWEVDYANRYAQPFIQSIQLFDAQGRPFSTADFLYGGGGGGGGSETRSSFGSTASWDATGITGTPDTLDLTVVITVSDQPPQMMGGGGGGGGSSAPVEQRLPVPPFEARYQFSLPFIPAVMAAQSSDTASDSGIDITLREIRYAPSITIGQICFTADVYPTYTSYPVSESGQPIEMGIGAQIESDDAANDCYQMSLLGVLADETGTLSLTFTDFITGQPDVSDERFDAFLTAVAAESFEADVVIEKISQGGYSVTVTAPEGVMIDTMPIYERVNQLALAHLHETISGRWELAVALR